MIYGSLAWILVGVIFAVAVVIISIFRIAGKDKSGILIAAVSSGVAPAGIYALHETTFWNPLAITAAWCMALGVAIGMMLGFSVRVSFVSDQERAVLIPAACSGAIVALLTVSVSMAGLYWAICSYWPNGVIAGATAFKLFRQPKSNTGKFLYSIAGGFLVGGVSLFLLGVVLPIALINLMETLR